MKKKKLTALFAAVLIAVLAVFVTQPLRVRNWDYGFAREVSHAEQEARLSFVQKAESWLGTAEGSDAHRQILDIYNSHTPLAQGYIVLESDNWCASFVSAVAIQCGLTDIIPTECGCQRQIGLFQDIARWEEDDGYIPLPGDIIYYSSSDTGSTGDCTAWSDHVGIVVGTCNGYIKVIEGNASDAVIYRYIKLDSKGIRGFALPEYQAE